MSGSTDRPVDRYGPTDVTPEEFERVVASTFAPLGSRLHNLRIAHKERVKGVDGEYVIDVTARFEQLGVSFLVLIEAKLHGRPVERSDVQVLHQKVISTGAQKGIVASSSGFQEGAVEFAKTHGIALMRIVERGALFETRAGVPVPHPRVPGLAAVHVEASETGGTRFTTLTGRPEYVAEMLSLG